MTLKHAFILVALVEAFYGAAGLLIPPSAIEPLLGWQLSPDGQWIVKLLGLALATQSATAWILRDRGTPDLAYVFAAYQIGASIVDASIWYALADQGIFANPMARYSVIAAIPTHLAIGGLLIAVAMRHGRS